jgi:hypothetical protein
VTGGIIGKVLTKTDLPYNNDGHLGPAGDWGKIFEKLCRKQICHTILLVTWDLLVTGGIIRKIMTKTDLPYNTGGDPGPAVDLGNYWKSYDENTSSIQYCKLPGTCYLTCLTRLTILYNLC